MRCDEYRLWVALHGCYICYFVVPLNGQYVERDGFPGAKHAEAVSQACHTENNGTSSKGPDSSCVPLCPHHHAVYDQGRKSFEWFFKVDMKAIAAQYYAAWLAEGNKP